MSNGNQEAEMIVRLALQGGMYMLKLTGQGAAHIAAMLAAMKNQPDNSPGKKRLTDMMKSGKELLVFTIPEARLKEFAGETKRYGIQYCIAKRAGDDGLYDLLVRAEDASKINRVCELLGIGRAGQISMDVTEPEAEKAVELSEAAKLINKMFEPNKKEMESGITNQEMMINPELEPEGIQVSEGSYPVNVNPDGTHSVRDEMSELKGEMDSAANVFSMARNLRQQMMGDIPVLNQTGWVPPEEKYDENGERLYRGKKAAEMDEKDGMQYMVDCEMLDRGFLSDDFISQMYKQGYSVDEKGMVNKLETNLTSRERELIARMMKETERAKEMEVSAK